MRGCGKSNPRGQLHCLTVCFLLLFLCSQSLNSAPVSGLPYSDEVPESPRTEGIVYKAALETGLWPGPQEMKKTDRSGLCIPGPGLKQDTCFGGQEPLCKKQPTFPQLRKLCAEAQPSLENSVFHKQAAAPETAPLRPVVTSCGRHACAPRRAVRSAAPSRSVDIS